MNKAEKIVLNNLNKLIATIIEFANNNFEILDFLFDEKVKMNKEVVHENIKLLIQKREILKKEYDFVIQYVKVNCQIIETIEKVNRLSLAKKKIAKAIKAIDNAILSYIIGYVGIELSPADTHNIFSQLMIDMEKNGEEKCTKKTLKKTTVKKK